MEPSPISSSVSLSSPPSRILITGVSGFVGGYLLDQCRSRYPNAHIFATYREQAESMLDRRGLIPLVADMTQAEQVRQAIIQAQPDLIFHLAAQASVALSWADPISTLRANVEGTLHLLDAVRAEQMQPRILLIGSGEQYGIVPPDKNPIREEQPFHPTNPYAVSKATQDLYGYQYFVAHQLPILRARAFNQFGPRQGAAFVVASFARQIALIEAGKMEPVLATGNLQARRDFLPVEDVVRAYIAIAEYGYPGEAYNIGSGHARSIEELLHLLLSFTSVPIRVYQDPARFRPVDQPLVIADTTRIRAHTGWKPAQNFEEAVKHTLDYWRSSV